MPLFRRNARWTPSEPFETVKPTSRTATCGRLPRPWPPIGGGESAADSPRPMETDGAGWTAWQLALLGMHCDDRVAARTGRSANAARLKWEELGIPTPSGHGWAAEELDLLGTALDAEVAAEIGRTDG